MKVLDIHKRTISLPKEDLIGLLKTLSTPNDRIWPYEKWPAMKFKGGIKVHAEGGHGPVRYSVVKYNPEKIIEFRFSQPSGFHGIHKFELNELTSDKTEIIHTIDMNTSIKGSLIWLFVIRHTHHALMEDGFDKLENSFSKDQKRTEWNLWVRILRKGFKMIKSRTD